MPAGLFSIESVKRLCAGVLVAVALAGCATAPSDPVEREIYDEANDPVQPLNEAIFEFNMAVDRAILRPVAQAYEFLLPDLVRDGVRNFVRHLKTPVILANDLMQGDIDRAGETMGRFIFNTVAGFGGVFDLAGEAGIEYHQEDFGQTLAVWGVDEGPYLMLPFIGPSSGRDAIGIIVDAGLDPLRWWGYNSSDFVVEHNGMIRTGAEAIDTRSRNYKQLEDLEETSLDFYATVRSLYRQQRESLIRNGSPDEDALPNIGFEGYDGIDTESDGKDTQTSLLN